MKTKLAWFLIIVLLTFSPGCWDIRDVNNIAFVMAIGLDKPTAPSTAKYKVTFEFAKPVVPQGNPDPKDLVSSVEADSIRQAIQRAQTNISRTISLSHLRVLVVGEEIAQQNDFRDLADYLMKDPEIALRLRLLFVKDNEAEALFYTKPKYENNLASEIVAMGELQRELALVRTHHFHDFLSSLRTTKGIALGSQASIDEEEQDLARFGSAIYKDWKLAGWLNAEEAQAANWLANQSEAIVVAKENGGLYTYEVSVANAKVTPVFNNGKLGFLVKVKTKGVVTEEAGKNIDLSKSVNVEKMETLLSKTVKRDIESAISKSQQELAIDYLGFGKKLQQHHPDTYKKLNWPEVFPTVPIKVEVTCKVKSSGLHT